MARSRSASADTLASTSMPMQPDDALAVRLPALRVALEQQYSFRCEQLATLVDRESEDGADPSEPEDRETMCARREVDAVLAAGARRALGDIELALARMDAGRYGFCRSCGAAIPLALLGAIPKTTLCLACRCREECGSRQQALRRTSRAFRITRRRATGSVSPARQESSGTMGRSRKVSWRDR